ncbi:UDP-N-acetylmuramate--L-alanine ligase [Actinomarinicola tropica]|uniref:UDP-N-acetylmuramate--L-alanine ligase n=1 Tax=Actinomarinicola tropica TaxID=2789776 RepID=A0A5Q2RQS5_9ACTN|nr:UDP-N-acetylmuramate--L-alanine ligase [Actinomarinicola tropica]QGG95545.1 UDP-N-acetylmuramate--L-alanine ligase [Actinomarinicola tropica]
MAELHATDLRLDEPRAVHVVYVGGKAMSAIAEILAGMGHTVSGSDPNDVPVLSRLRAAGVHAHVGVDPERAAAADLVVASTAVRPDHPDVVAARAHGVPVAGRPAAQGAIARTRPTVAVSGTHGKTTTTAMLVHVLLETGRDPSFIVGGDLGGAAGGVRWTPGGWFVVEGDESDGTFLELGASRVVVTNVEADHLDHYGTLDAIEQAFDRFLDQAGEDRVVCADDPIAARLGRRHGARTYGIAPDADLRVADVAIDRGRTTFSLHDGGRVVDVALPLPGEHNATNAAGALLAAAGLGVPLEEGAATLATFAGVGRRFERRGEAAGVTLVDDYAHNPGKVRAVVRAAASGGWGRVVVVFQPHRYSRTADLWREFADSFTGADVVVVTALDPAGEDPIPGVSGRMIADAVVAAHPEMQLSYLDDRSALVPTLARLLVPGDLCLTLGAGDITRLADELLPALTEGAP